jgi:hypothetical protein
MGMPGSRVGARIAVESDKQQWRSPMPLRYQRVRERAAEILGRQQADARVAESVLRSIRRQQIELEATIHNVNLAQQRLVHFQPEIDGRLQCPRCWIENELRSSLTKIRGTDRYELFGCDRCSLELAVPPKE